MSSDDRTPPGGGDADATRLSDVKSPSSSTGWLSSSGAIDHGRFPPGTVLGDRYRVVGRLGRGGMGEVFRADDLKLGQPVALKFLPPDVDRDPARLTQLHTEVRMARQVSHPNVCRVYDIDDVDGHTFLSMEYVDGEDLASLLRRVGRFPEDRGVEIARQVCAGLASAHERGVVHRDLKPANVMIDGSGRVRITDFGLAGIAGESLRAGTPAYMAPEQLAGGEVTARSDIYALGLVLYEIFTGRRALEADSLAELIRRREQAEIVPPSALTTGLSPEIDRAVMRCLTPEPAARPASALAVAAALPGGDPLAAALAAGETPSPEMVAAAGEAGSLARLPGVALLSFVLAGLVGIAFASDRLLLVNRVALTKSTDVLEERAREIIALAGYSNAPADTARGVALTIEHAMWAARRQTPRRWDALSSGEAPVLRYWYRTSPRTLVPLSTSWTPQLNDPPLAVSGMISVVVDERGRLVELVSMPPQLDPSEPDGAAVEWRTFFDAAGLPMAAFTEVAPHWTPRTYAEERMAWEGPIAGGTPETKMRVEAASYRGRPVSFQLVWPWTRPSSMEQRAPSARERVLSAAATLFVLSLMAGAIALVRYNLKSGRADRRGAARLSAFLIAVWLASWLVGARHFFAIEEEANRFFYFLALAITNTGSTWLFYLALEPFVRRLFPEMLIGWTRLLAGQLRDTRVGRDLLIGVALGVFFAVVSTAAPLLFAWSAGSQPFPQPSNVNYLLGFRYTLSTMLRLIPNALQTALLGTFAYVVLLTIVRRRWIATALVVALLAGGVIVAESGDDPLWTGLLFAALIGGPAMFVFQRYGLLAIATGLLANFWIKSVPFTTDLMRPHAGAASFVIFLLFAAAVYAFWISRAGKGMFRRLLQPV